MVKISIKTEKLQQRIEIKKKVTLFFSLQNRMNMHRLLVLLSLFA